MKKLLLVLSVLLCACTNQVSAQSAANMVPGYYSKGACPGGASTCFFPGNASPPLGYQQLTSLTTSTALTVPAGAVEALIVCESQTIRWRDDGVAPTASVGMPLSADVSFPYMGNLSALRLIETTPSATCNVSYYQ